MRFPSQGNPSDEDKALALLRRLVGRGCVFSVGPDGRTLRYEMFAHASFEPLSEAERDEIRASKWALIEVLKPRPTRPFPVRGRLAAAKPPPAVAVAEVPTEPDPIPVA